MSLDVIILNIHARNVKCQEQKGQVNIKGPSPAVIVGDKS
jgi:hypothetical protein